MRRGEARRAAERACGTGQVWRSRRRGRWPRRGPRLPALRDSGDRSGGTDAGLASWHWAGFALPCRAGSALLLVFSPRRGV